MKNPQIAILASGEGTTAEAFITAGATGNIDAQAGLIICNNPDAGIFGKVKKLNKHYGLSIECRYISKKNFPAKSEKLTPGQQTAAEEQAILDVLAAGNFDLIALMGYMKKVGPRLVREYGWRAKYNSPYQAMMLNTHPGLLPATKGLYGIAVQEFVLKNHHKFAEQTLHVVAENYDDGPIIIQHKIAVQKNDTPEILFERVKKIEKQNLPYDIDKFINSRRKYNNEQ